MNSKHVYEILPELCYDFELKTKQKIQRLNNQFTKVFHNVMQRKYKKSAKVCSAMTYLSSLILQFNMY